jgi:hypothetical protein
MEYTETNIEKLARLEKELAEVRENLEQDSTPDIDYGQYYKKNGVYYVVISYAATYILANLKYGTRWSLDEGTSYEMKKELAKNDFVFVGTYEDYLKAIK